jgi:hypothetical protein
MLPSPLEIIWRCADVSSSAPVFPQDDIARWGKEPFGFLRRLGFFREAETAWDTLCPACGEHAEEAIQHTFPDGKIRFFIPCPRHGPQEIPSEQLRQWQLDFTPILRTLGDEFVLSGFETIVPGRLWNLGRPRISGKSLNLWVGRNLNRDDAARILERLPRGNSTLLLHMGQPPESALLPHVLPEYVIALRDVTHADEEHLVVNREVLESAVDLAASGLSPQGEHVFQDQGATWLLAYEGVVKTVRNSVGMPYVRYLLEHPGKDVDAIQLRRAVSGDFGKYALGSAGEHLTDDSVKSYKARHRDLAEEIEEAERNHDFYRKKKLMEELESLQDELKGGLGLNGRKRKASNDLDRNRQTVSKGVSRALDTIRKQHEALWRHLHNSITQGSVFSYKPDRPIHWVT